MIANEENINIMFSKMKDEGWDTSKPLKWGFYFYSKLEDNLKEVYSELVDHDYHVEHVSESEDKEWVLHVSKQETLTSDKLHRRNIAFNELAEAYDSYYDGWDVDKNI